MHRRTRRGRGGGQRGGHGLTVPPESFKSRKAGQISSNYKIRASFAEISGKDGKFVSRVIFAKVIRLPSSQNFLAHAPTNK